MTARSPAGRAEIALLAALLFTLPLLEVPKQLCWLGWAVLAGRAVWRDRAVPGGGPSAWDAVLAAVLAAVLLSGLGAPAPPGWHGAGDDLRLVSVPWLMMRRGYRAADCRVPLLAALAGTAVASLWGLARVLTASTPVFLQLHPVRRSYPSGLSLPRTLGVALAALRSYGPAAKRRVGLFARP